MITEREFNVMLPNGMLTEVGQSVHNHLHAQQPPLSRSSFSNAPTDASLSLLHSKPEPLESVGEIEGNNSPMMSLQQNDAAVSTTGVVCATPASEAIGFDASSSKVITTSVGFAPSSHSGSSKLPNDDPFLTIVSAKDTFSTKFNEPNYFSVKGTSPVSMRVGVEHLTPFEQEKAVRSTGRGCSLRDKAREAFRVRESSLLVVEGLLVLMIVVRPVVHVLCSAAVASAVGCRQLLIFFDGCGACSCDCALLRYFATVPNRKFGIPLLSIRVLYMY
jgi:hypothetical protein